MELNWSTFVLEIINFLVLLWILKRFLYKPVLAVIARRKAGIEKTLADADARFNEAERLRAEYEGRLTEWDKERQRRRAKLAADVEAERTRKLAELQTVMDQEREKTRVIEARRDADARNKVEEAALAQAARFAARLLEQASGPELEARLVDLVIAGLSRLPDARVAALREQAGQLEGDISVLTAFPLSDERRRRLQHALTPLVGDGAALHFDQDDKLIAGARITLGAWVLGTNLQDELRGFAALDHGAESHN